MSILKELLETDRLMEKVITEKYAGMTSVAINQEIDNILKLLAEEDGSENFKKVLKKKATILANIWIRRMA